MATASGTGSTGISLQPADVNLVDPTLSNQEVKDIAGTGLPTGTTTFPGGGNLGTWIEQEDISGQVPGHANPWAGFSLPGADVSAFMSMIGQVETWMANVGYDNRYMPNPLQMQYAVEHHLADNPYALWQYFSQQTQAGNDVPSAQYGMTMDQYQKTTEAISNALFDATGQTDWAAAGLDDATRQKAIQNGWTSTQLSSYIQQNPTLNSKYGYLQYGYTYNTYNQWKQSNKSQAQLFYGQTPTDANYLELLANPKTAATSSGNSVQESPSTVAATGRQSFIR